MRNSIKVVCISLIVIALGACSSLPRKYQVFRNNSKDYLQAGTVPPLRIPPGYASASIDDYYPVPNAQKAQALSSASPALLPPNISRKDVPPEESWFMKWFPHAHESWEAPVKPDS